jgi:hypothetical protein
MPHHVPEEEKTKDVVAKQQKSSLLPSIPMKPTPGEQEKVVIDLRVTTV